MVPSPLSFHESSADPTRRRAGGAAGPFAFLREVSACAGSSDTSGREPARTCCSRASSDSSTAATTRPGSRCWRTTALDYVRAVGNLQVLKQEAGHERLAGANRARPHALGNPRRREQQNAHPLTGCDEGKLAIVLNGIVENYRELQGLAGGRGAHLPHRDRRRGGRAPDRAPLQGDLLEARRSAYKELEGHFAFVVIHHDHPEELVGARLQCPLLVGVGTARCSWPRWPRRSSTRPGRSS